MERLFLALGLLPAPLPAAPDHEDEPLFAFVQTSDSQPVTAAHWQRLERVFETIADAGQPGALLPLPVRFVLFPGDLVDDGGVIAEWDTFVAALDQHLTANGIPFFAIPGNHDGFNGGIANYEQYITSADPWEARLEGALSHNGLAVATGWRGLTLVGVNAYDGGDDNQVSAADQADVEARVAAAHARGENVLFMSHFPHDDEGRRPLDGALGIDSVVALVRGHTGNPSVTPGLAGVSNPNVWDSNSNSILHNEGLIYYEVFAGELRAFVLELDENPTQLPAPVVLPLVHALQPAGSPGGATAETLTFAPEADASVTSANPGANFGGASMLRVRGSSGGNTWDSYLRFDVDGIGAGEVLSARLELTVQNGSQSGGEVLRTSSGWSETGVDWSSAPGPQGGVLDAVGSAGAGQRVSFDVTAAVAGDGPASFLLRSSSTDAVDYVSREGSPDPLLVVEVMPELVAAAVTPAAVEALVPGTGPAVTVSGAGFTGVMTAALDGVPVDAARVTLVDAATVELDLSQVPLGSHVLELRDGARADTIAFDVVASTTPRLQLGTGEALDPWSNGQETAVLASGPLGAVQVVLWSTSPLPSSIPLVSLALGNGFQELDDLVTVVVPGAGYVEVPLPIGGIGAPLDVYFQSIQLGSERPFPVSNLQSLRLSP